MPLFHLRPIAEMEERLEFLSLVTAAEQGEQVQAMRALPRQTVRYQYVIQSADWTSYRQLTSQNGPGPYDVPLWFNADNAGALASGTTTILIANVAERDYVVGGKLIVSQSNTLFEEATIASIDAFGVTITAGLVNNYTDAVVAPTRSGILAEGLSANWIQGLFLRGAASFVITGTSDLQPTWTRGTYRGEFVLPDAPKLTRSVSELLIRQTNYIDSGLGIIATEAERALFEERKTLSFYTNTPAGRRDLREVVYQLRGRQRAFWQPSWAQDFAITASSGGTADINVATLPDRAYPVGRDLYVRLTTGEEYLRRITAVTVADAAQDTLTLDSALPGFAPSVVQIACYATLSRADTDTFSFEHVADHKTTLSFVTKDTFA